jgi:hypothetical protein
MPVLLTPVLTVLGLIKVYIWFVRNTIFSLQLHAAALLGWFLENRESVKFCLYHITFFYKNLSVVLGFSDI